MVSVYLLWPLQQQFDLERIPNLLNSSAIKMDFLKKELGSLATATRAILVYDCSVLQSCLFKCYQNGFLKEGTGSTRYSYESNHCI